MKIFVKGLEFVGRHGVFEEERRDGRRFCVDLEVVVDDHSSVRSDELEQTLDYRDLAQVIMEVAEGPSRLLVEKMAGDILEAVFARHADVREASVCVRKHAPDVVGAPQWVGVELMRRRDEQGLGQARTVDVL